MSSTALAASIIADISELAAWKKSHIQRIVDAHTKIEQPLARTHFEGWIDDISVEGVRAFGSAQVARLSRGLTIIYAENGSGKTSFVDALELLTTGYTSRAAQYPQLEAEVRDNDHVQHSTVEGQACSPTARVSVRWRSDVNGKVRDSTWGGTWGEAAPDAPPVHLLARRRLREIIALKAVERAARLGNALGLGDLVAEWSSAQASLNDEYRKLLANSGPGEDISELVIRFGRAMPTATAEQLEAHIREEADTELGKQTANPTSPPVPDRPPVPRPPTLPALGNLKDALADLEESTPGTGQLTSTIPSGLLDLLRAFKEVAIPHMRCPACNDGTVAEERLVEVEQFLQDLDFQAEMRAKQKVAFEKAKRALEALDLRELTWTPSSHFGPVVADQFSGGESDAAPMRRLETAAELWATSLKTLMDARRGALETPSATSLASVLNAAADLSVQRPEAEKAAVLAEAERLDTIQRQLESSASPEARKAEELRQNASRIASAVLRERVVRSRAQAIKEASGTLKDRLDQVVAAKCQDLAEPINSWMERLAPDNTPDISVSTRKTAGRTALDLFVAGGKVRAIGRLSDSQLDMLGLAAHLATLEREAPGQPLFIDDPTDMLDHRTRDRLAGDGIARLLMGPSNLTRQVVVLTHDDQFVRSLWRHHGQRWPATSQLLLEVDHSTKPAQSLIVPRTAEEYLARVNALLSDHPNDGNRLWLRSAAGNQLRQSIEVLAKDIHTVLGPLGLQYLPAGSSNLGEAGAGAAYAAVAPTIQKIQEIHDECAEKRHFSARGPLARLLDCLDRRKEYMLDEASHSDFVYPSVERIREYASQLQHLARMLVSRGQAHPDEWPKESGWAHALALCPNCEPLQIGLAA